MGPQVKGVRSLPWQLAAVRKPTAVGPMGYENPICTRKVQHICMVIVVLIGVATCR